MIRACALLALLASTSTLGAQPDKKSVDAFGDPLPAGAVARLGTIRLRDGIHRLAITPDGKTMFAHAAGAYRRYDVATGREIDVIGASTSHRLSYSAISGDGRILVTASYGGDLEVCDTSTKTVRKIASQARSLALSSDGSRIAVTSNENTIFVYDAASGAKLLETKAPTSRVLSIAISGDGKRVAFPLEEIGSDRTTIDVWDVDARKRVSAIETARRSAAVALARDGARLAASTYAGEIDVWKIDDRRLEQRRAGAGTAEVLTFSPDGKRLAAASRSGHGIVFRLDDADAPIVSFHRPCRYLSHVSFAPTGRIIAWAGDGGAPIVWDVESGKTLNTLAGHSGSVCSLQYSGDGRRLTSADSNGTIIRWNVASLEQVETFNLAIDRGVRRYSSSMVRISPRGDLAAITLPDRGIVLVDLATKRDFLRLDDETTSDSSFGAFSNDGAFFGKCDMNGVQVWSLKTQRRIFGDADGKTRGFAIAVAPNGKRVACLEKSKKGSDLNLNLYDVNVGEPVSLTTLVALRLDLAFSCDGAILVYTANPRGLSLVNAADGQTLGEFEINLTDVPTPLAFSRDGRFLAVADPCAETPAPDKPAAGRTNRSTIKIIELASRKVRREIPNVPSPETIAFSPDGRRLATAGGDTAIHLWDLDSVKPDGTPREIDIALNDLTSSDAPRADRAIRLLLTDPRHAFAMIDKHVKPTPVDLAGVAAIEALVAKLDDKDFRTRERAMNSLIEKGNAAAPILRRALEKEPSLEFRRRAVKALTAVSKPGAPTPELLQAVRAIEILERIADEPARRLLRQLAAGDPAAISTQHAKGALDRIGP